MYKITVGVLVIIAAAFFARGNASLFSGARQLALREPPRPVCPAAKPGNAHPEPYYTGPLIDAHLHMPVSSRVVSAVGKQIGFEDVPYLGGALALDKIVCLTEHENTAQIFGFFLFTRFSSSAEISAIKKARAVHPGRIAAFFMPAPYASLRIDPVKTKEILQKNRGLFTGIGEIKSFDGAPLDNPHFSALYHFANEERLVVMIHPYHRHRATIENILRQYPEVRFLLHGGDIDAWIMDVMRDHPNVYYTVDNVSKLYGWERKHAEKSPGKDAFLAYLESREDALIAEGLGAWHTRIETYPDRFLWGTDRWYGWMFDEEVSAANTAFGRRFIGALDPSVQERFAYKNAERLLKGASEE